jgi:hypothetical protein
MNTCGLIQVVVLEIGFELGILTPTVFTMMVFMARVTTFMTCPVLSTIDYFRRKKVRVGAKSFFKSI